MESGDRIRVLMLLENNPYPEDYRVRCEANVLSANGYEVTVISPMGLGQPWHEVCQGVRIYRFPSPPQANGLLGYLWEYGYSMVATFLISLLVTLRHGFDVVHTHNPPDTFVLFVALYKLLGKSFVYDHHDVVPEMYYARFRGRGSPLIFQALVWFERLSCRLADHVIATNQSYKAIEMRRGGVPEDRISIVRNGPYVNRGRPIKIDSCLRREGKINLCYVGVMGCHDGLDYLLRALQHLVYELGRTDILCVLIGAGDAWLETKALAEQLCLSDYTRFRGWVGEAQVDRYLRAADICLAPEPSNSYNDRSTVIKMMEYMAFEKPIVAFDLPEHRITAQDAAVYARPNEVFDFALKIAWLMDNAERRKEMGKIGRKLIEAELAWEYQAKYLLEVYTKLGKRLGS